MGGLRRIRGAALLEATPFNLHFHPTDNVIQSITTLAKKILTLHYTSLCQILTDKIAFGHLSLCFSDHSFPGISPAHMQIQNKVMQGSFCYTFESQTLISQGSDDGGQNMSEVYRHEEHDELNWE